MNKIFDFRPVRFIIIGIINTIVGTAVMFGLYNLAGCSYWISSAANYVFASILSYALNRKYTFGYSGGTAVSLVRFAVNIAVCYFIAYGAARPFMSYLFEDAAVRLQENAAMLTGMVIFTALNYAGQKFFVFGDSGK